jgi:type II secretion system protein G
MKTSLAKGFTLIELVVVVAILAILAGVIVPRVSGNMAYSRDTRRLADVRRVRQAIEQYHADKGEYPAPRTNAAFGGWDVSHDEGFIDVLQEAGYLDEAAVDPVNDVTYHYRYYVYANGSYGCAGEGPYYVLGIRNFESPEFAAKNVGFFQCASRNWCAEFAYVTGGGATFQ